MIKGTHHTKEAKRKISEAQMGNTHSLGHCHTEETKRKIGEFHRGNIYGLGYRHTEEAKRRISQANMGNTKSLGYHQTEETKRKMSIAKKGHTYALGYHHTEEAKKKMRGRIISEEAKQNMSNVRIGKMPKNMQESGKYGYIERGYYNINGKEIFFRSKWEANYALYLDFLIKQKQIKKWTYEKDTFIFEKIKSGTRSYRPDFKIYNNDATTEYHEVKGYMDSKSKTKLKRMAKYYPNTKLLIIDKDVYSDIKNKLGKMLKFY